MVKNNIYPWAQGINANVLTDEEYVDSLSTNGIYENGVKSGIASSSQINKTLRQATVPASGLSQFIVDTLNIDVNDNDSINIFSDRITNSILKLAQINPFNQSFANAIGGYRKYAIVSCDNNNFWVSTKDNNLTIPGNVNSDWVNLFDSAIKWANSEFLRLKSETKQEVKSDVKFSKLLETDNQTVNGNIDIRGIEKSDGKMNISKMIHLWIRDDVSGWMNVEEIIGLVTNIVIGVQGGGITNYFRLNNMGKLTCNDLQINKSINCDTITTNDQTVNGNINMYGIEKSDGKVNISKMYHIWIRDDVSGWMNVEEIIGDRTNIVLGVKGGGTTGYFRLSNLGDFSCNSITAGMINASGNIHAGSADISGKMNANTIETPGDITINSGNRTWDDGGHFNGNALFCKKDDGLFYKLWLYDQLNVGSMAKLSINDKYEFHFRDNGTIDAKEFNGVSMSSFCADLAEYYIADERYDPGTLVRIGGEKEITRASIGGFFYGVISTAPAYVMNTAISDERNALPVALAGRVPVLMTGMIDKGDPITISEISGVARKAGDGEKHIGFSLENSHETSIRHVECVIKQN